MENNEKYQGVNKYSSTMNNLVCDYMPAFLKGEIIFSLLRYEFMMIVLDQLLIPNVIELD